MSCRAACRSFARGSAAYGRAVQVLGLMLSLAIHAFLVVAFFGGAALPGGWGEYDPAAGLVTVDLTGFSHEPLRHAREQTAEPASRQTAIQDAKRYHVHDVMLGRGSSSRYFLPSELTRKPLVAMDVPEDLELVVPGVPRQAAVLRLLISEYGDVDEVQIENSLLPEVARKTVVNAFSKIRFYPGEIKGVPVKSQIRVEVLLNDPAATDKEKGR